MYKHIVGCTFELNWNELHLKHDCFSKVFIQLNFLKHHQNTSFSLIEQALYCYHLKMHLKKPYQIASIWKKVELSITQRNDVLSHEAACLWANGDGVDGVMTLSE